MRINIAIDGPSAAGKSTIASLLAERLGYVHLNTGSMYRACAYKALQNQVSLDDEDSLVALLGASALEMKEDGSVILDGNDISHAIRSDEVSLAASRVSRHPGVRRALVHKQQEISAKGGYILDGRDIGTVVLPHAQVKVFMTASAHARAMRRLKQNLEEGIETSDLATIEKEIEERDYQDTHRAASPLTKAEDAVVIDTSDLSIPETVEKIYDLARPYIEENGAVK